MSLMKRLEKEKGVQLTGVNGMREHGAPEKNGKNQFEELKAQIHKKIIEDTKTEGFGNGKAAEKENAAAIEEIAISIIDQDGDFVSAFEKEQIISQIKDDVLGFGPINPLIQDPDVTEIMVNGPRQVYVERKGKLELTKISFRDDAHVLRVIERIVSPLGRRIDESSPMVDARLPDGSRVNAIIPPLSLVGPCITIRKFSKDPFQVADLVRFGTLTPEIAKFLESCVKAKLNIVVSGGTGSGKTTTLNVLSSFIPNGERVVTIEDAAELQMRQEHVITLETRPANIEGRGAVTMRDLVRNSLRMRPERIVVGEVRGGEALDMLQAMNTGHDGSLTTGH
ncbi:MAG: CpaF family protein, partial [Clostridia bacterium]|nr:CpaF family protein [Clostridia bacterium]